MEMPSYTSKPWTRKLLHVKKFSGSILDCELCLDEVMCAVCKSENFSVYVFPFNLFDLVVHGLCK